MSAPEELAYYQAYAPQETPLAELARVAATRWSIEECFERAKGEVGLDHYEVVRRWAGWHRHVTLCLLAKAFLEVTSTRANVEEAEKGGASTEELIPLKAPPLLALAHPVEEHGFRRHWWEWRRRRQAAAIYENNGPSKDEMRL